MTIGVVSEYMRRADAFRTHKVKSGYEKTVCHQRISAAWIAVDENEWQLSPCLQCKAMGD